MFVLNIYMSLKKNWVGSMKTPIYHNEEDILDFFKDFLEEEDLENFIKSRILTRGAIIDDPLDFSQLDGAGLYVCE